MHNVKIRSFIAIDLPPVIRQAVFNVTTCLKRNLARLPIRWVDTDSIHLTLRFLGEISPVQITNLVPLIHPIINKMSGINLTVFGIGAYPNIHRARVLWLGSKLSPDLAPIIHEMDNTLKNLGIPKEDRRFSPHLTIGRVKYGASSADYTKIDAELSKTEVGIIGSFQVQSVNIYRSDLPPPDQYIHAYTLYR